jgi:hypothetical protein
VPGGRTSTEREGASAAEPGVLDISPNRARNPNSPVRIFHLHRYQSIPNPSFSFLVIQNCFKHHIALPTYRTSSVWITPVASILTQN